MNETDVTIEPTAVVLPDVDVVIDVIPVPTNSTNLPIDLPTNVVITA